MRKLPSTLSLKRQIESEIAAQFEAYRATGLPLDHVNGHRHFQLHPVVAAPIIDIGRRYGMRALRVPVEPWRIIAGIDPHTQRRLGRDRGAVGGLAATARPRRRTDDGRCGVRIGVVGRDDEGPRCRAAAPACRPASSKSTCIRR